MRKIIVLPLLALILTGCNYSTSSISTTNSPNKEDVLEKLDISESAKKAFEQASSETRHKNIGGGNKK